MMKNKGVFFFFDYKTLRMKPLSLNLQRCGITNNIITLMEGRWFKDIKFDRILVDAPCSGTGTIRKSLKTLRMWNPNMIRRLAGTQKQLICQAFSCLKKGGTMVYSTCSLEPEEDEAVIDYFLSKCGDAKLEEIEIDIKRGEPVMEFDGNTYNPEVKKCLRIWPQDNDTEGFFVVKIKKV
jgi:16S rRNA C967 or C1407 C5-methylase (RsmB/RsmF family)